MLSRGFLGLPVRSGPAQFFMQHQENEALWQVTRSGTLFELITDGYRNTSSADQRLKKLKWSSEMFIVEV